MAGKWVAGLSAQYNQNLNPQNIMKANVLPFTRNFSLAALMLALMAVAVSGARAQNENRGQLTPKDYKFVNDAAQAGSTEVTLGQLASEKATATQVRDFGKRMVQDHQKANDELKALAAKKGAVVMDTPTKKDEREIDRLKGLSGVEFDKAYVKAMVEAHKQAVKEFQQASAKADDMDLRDWATKTLPTLQEHLQMIQNLETTVASAQ
jgi:putative membrane protein